MYLLENADDEGRWDSFNVARRLHSARDGLWALENQLIALDIVYLVHAGIISCRLANYGENRKTENIYQDSGNHVFILHHHILKDLKSQNNIQSWLETRFWCLGVRDLLEYVCCESLYFATTQRLYTPAIPLSCQRTWPITHYSRYMITVTHFLRSFAYSFLDSLSEHNMRRF
jgi:hypothetical protein